MRNLSKMELVKKLLKMRQPRKFEATKGAIPNTGRVERVLKLIVFLNEWQYIGEIAEHLQVSKKSVHRYIALLVKLGFDLEQLPYYRILYRIANTKEFFNFKGTKSKIFSTYTRARRITGIKNRT